MPKKMNPADRRKCVNFSLTPSVISRIRKLSEHECLSMSRIVERAIGLYYNASGGVS